MADEAMTDELFWQGLAARVRARVADFPGVAGVCVQDLIGPGGLAVNGDEQFPTASTIKIHILAQLFLRAERGELDLSAPVAFPGPALVPGSGVLNYLDDPLTLSRRDVAGLMIIASDNTATNLCIDWAGLDETNALIRQMGLTRTILQRKMYDLGGAAAGRENLATPAELAQMLALLHAGQPTPTVAARVLELLKRPVHGFLDRAVPPGVAVANKPGWVTGAICDAGIVFLPRRPYAVALMTKFSVAEPWPQEKFVVDLFVEIQRWLAVLDGSNDAGRQIP